MKELSTEAELAWLDWLDAKTDADKSGAPMDRVVADRRWEQFMAAFMPPELRELSLKISAEMRRKP